MDYESPKKLADYLKYLDTNSTAYNSYFKWKKHVNFFDYVVDFQMSICEMCIFLHLENSNDINKSKRIKDLDKYWSSKDCVIPEFINLIKFNRVT